MVAVSYVVEGQSDEPMAESLLAHVGAEPGYRVVTHGKAKLDQRLAGINRSAGIHHPWFILRDSDDDDHEGCRGALVSTLFQGSTISNGLVFRMAVRSIESWLMADHPAFSTFFGVSHARLPVNPDGEVDPKGSLVGLARASSKREIREGIAPRPEARRRVGPRYTELVTAYMRTHWRLERARLASPSLDRAAIRLSERVDQWR